MVRSQAHSRGVAWLAFFAIWLTLVAPVVSQVVAAVGSPAMASASPACAEHLGHAVPPATPHPSVPPTDRCGYCTLVAHSPVVIAAAWLPLLLPRTAYLPPALPAAPGLRRHAWLATTPRGPPGFVNA